MFGKSAQPNPGNVTINGARLHLRVDPDGSGTLVINAAAVLYLDRVAVDYLRLYLGFVKEPPKSGTIAENVALQMSKRYRVHRKKAEEDFAALLEKVFGVAKGDRCPFSDYGIERVDPFSRPLRAPYRIDCALTYRCHCNCAHCYLQGGPHVTPELKTADWWKILDKIADFEVPSITFTGGEPLLRSDLEELISYSQQKGLVCGLITNGRLLTGDRVEKLAAAGLDYIQITLESSDPAIHDRMVSAPGAWEETVAGIKRSVGTLFTTTNTTLTPENESSLSSTVDFLHALGVSRMGVNAIIRSGRGEEFPALPVERVEQAVEEAAARAGGLGMQFLWYTPTCYLKLNPVEMGLGAKCCSAASTTLAIEPNGDIIPCQSYFVPIGNALNGTFEEAWQHPLAKHLREREYLTDECKACSEVPLCAGGCPLEEPCKQG